MWSLHSARSSCLRRDSSAIVAPILKERGGQGRYITTGVRWAESAARKKNRGIFENGHSNPEKRVILNNDNDDRRRLFETCMRQHKAVCNPIIDWSDADVWDYIESEKIPVNPLSVRLFPCRVRRVSHGGYARQTKGV